MKVIYFLAIECHDGNAVIEGTCPVDLINFIMDIQENVGNMALAYEEIGGKK